MSGLFFLKEKPRVIRLVMLQEGGLICMQPRLHQQILITVSKKPVCLWGAHETAHFQCSRVPSVLLSMCPDVSWELWSHQAAAWRPTGGCQSTHTTHTVGSVWTRAVENMTLLEMQNQPRQSIKTSGIWFFFSTSLHVWICIYSCFFYDFSGSTLRDTGRDIKLPGSGLLWSCPLKSILLDRQGLEFYLATHQLMRTICSLNSCR